MLANLLTHTLFTQKILVTNERETQQWRQRNKDTLSPLKKAAAVKKAEAAAEKADAAAKKKAATAKKKADAAAKKKAATAKKKADAVKKKADAAAAKKNADAAAAKNKADAAAAKNKAVAAFKLNDTVLAKYGGGWYAAQIFNVRRDGKYDVYFPEDRVVALVARTQIKAIGIPIPYWAKMSRADFVTLKFDHDEHSKDARDCDCKQHDGGEYYIKSMGVGEAANKYICTHTEDADFEFLYEFDMGYVQRVLLRDIFPFDADADSN
jgi:hypothetical protein